MAKLNKQELLEKIKQFIGDRTDDNALALIEDITDSFEEDSVDWKSKYDELDKEWRKKYRARFFNDVDDKKDDELIETEDKEENSIDDLFVKE